MKNVFLEIENLNLKRKSQKLIKNRQKRSIINLCLKKFIKMRQNWDQDIQEF